MLRITAGTDRGRKLNFPEIKTARPTMERSREALFSKLHAHFGGFDALKMLDAFAGSGIMGIEAISRGVAHVDYVETDRQLCAILASNLKTLGYDAKSRVICAKMPDAAKHLNEKYDIVFVDPPYEAEKLLSQSLEILAKKIRINGILIAEYRSNHRFDEITPENMTLNDQRKYGENAFAFFTCEKEI